MYDQNTHGWRPLQPRTIEIKKTIKDLYRQPESINIRLGDIYKSQTNPKYYDTKKTSDGTVISQRYKSSKVPVGLQLRTMAKWDRDVRIITQQEMTSITDSLVQDIINQLKRHGR